MEQQEQEEEEEWQEQGEEQELEREGHVWVGEWQLKKADGRVQEGEEHVQEEVRGHGWQQGPGQETPFPYEL